MSSRRPPSSSSPNRPSRLGEVVVKWGRWCVVEVEEGVVGGGGGCGGGCGGGGGPGDDGAGECDYDDDKRLVLLSISEVSAYSNVLELRSKLLP